MTSPLYIPNAELVAKHWLLAAVAGLAGKVATTLPDLPWPDNEFVQVMAVGGSPDPEIPQLHPVVTVNAFAAKPGSLKPPWNKAATLAMGIWAACYQKRYAPHAAVELSLPSGYGRALVQSVFPVGEVKRLPSDASQYAVYSLDIQINWVPGSLEVVAA